MKAIALLLLVSVVFGISVVPLGKFACEDAAFLNLVKPCPKCNATLFVSAFDGNPLADDSIFVVENFDSLLSQFSKIQPKLASTAITWPNKIFQTPSGIFSFDSVTVAGGFLVPGKSTGAINIMSKEDYSTIQISTDDSEWFYHMGVWRDMNGDGKLDWLTARAIKPILEGNPQGQLLWYEQPQSSPEQGFWDEHDLFTGPDIFFRVVDLNNDGTDEILAAEFFNASLSIYYSPSGNLSNPSDIVQVIVDNTIGPLFDAYLVDVNGDGKPEILATNHINDSPSTSGVYAYEIPTNWKTQPFVKHVLAEGFIVRESGFAQAAPGNAIAFTPKIGSNSKPWIALSGDGSQQAYLLQPVSQDPKNWNYKTSVLLDSQGTVGQVVVGDADNNGFSEIYLSIYDQGIVYGYTFSD